MQITEPAPPAAYIAERELGTLLGTPSDGGTWADRVRRVVDEAPPFTAAQRERLKLLLSQRPARPDNVP